MYCHACGEQLLRGPAGADAVATPDGVLCRGCAHRIWPGGAPDR
jgi:hypothetical protein